MDLAKSTASKLPELRKMLSDIPNLTADKLTWKEAKKVECDEEEEGDDAPEGVHPGYQLGEPARYGMTLEWQY